MANKKNNLYKDSFDEIMDEDVDAAEKFLNNSFETKSVATEKKIKTNDKKEINLNSSENETMEFLPDLEIDDVKGKKMNIYLKSSDLQLIERLEKLCKEKGFKKPKNIDLLILGIKKAIAKLENK